MIGEVLRPQGVHGEAKIRPFSAAPDAFLKWKTVYLCDKGQYQPIGMKCSRVHDGFAYATLDDVDRLRGRELWIDRAHAMKLAKDEVYISDLIGCKAVDENGQEIGTLKDVLQHGPVDVYVFRTPKGEMMAPALKAVFTDVDVEAQLISVDSTKLNEVAVFED